MKSNRVALTRRSQMRLSFDDGMGEIWEWYIALPKRCRQREIYSMLCVGFAARQGLALGTVLALPTGLATTSQAPVADASNNVSAKGGTNMAQTLADLHPRPCVIPMYSTVRAEVVAGPELGAQYWTENLRQPVRFCACG